MLGPDELLMMEHRGIRFINCLKDEVWMFEHNVAPIDAIEDLKIVVDIGAHVGFTSLPAAKKGAIVYAFEPNIWNFARLINNLELNEIETVKPFCLAVTDGSHWADLKMVDGSPGQSSVMYNEKVTHFCDARTVSLADVIQLVNAPIDLLKIDCEGSEYLIFEGAEDFLFDKVKAIKLELHDINDERYFYANPWVGTRQPLTVRLLELGYVRHATVDGLWVQDNGS